MDEVEKEKDEFNPIIVVLEDNTPRNNTYIEAKNKFLNSIKKIFEGRVKLLKGLKTEYFHLITMKHGRNKWDTKEKKKED